MLSAEDWVVAFSNHLRKKAGINTDEALTIAESSLACLDGDTETDPIDAADDEMYYWAQNH